MKNMQNVGTKNVFTPKNIDGTMFSNEHLVSIRCGVLGSQFFFSFFWKLLGSQLDSNNWLR